MRRVAQDATTVRLFVIQLDGRPVSWWSSRVRAVKERDRLMQETDEPNLKIDEVKVPITPVELATWLTIVATNI